jgi:arylsulfatase A-like enzyme
MKAIMMMFDTLCRRFLPPYGCDWVHAPNFQRLATRSVQFQNAYVGSMPCMPARREIHTGRSNFLHRSWGPLEPFDDSMPEILARAGVHTHKVTDHFHYWGDGGATYHNRYSTYQFVRGQCGDRFHGWCGEISEEEAASNRNNIKPGRPPYTDWRTQDHVNRQVLTSDEVMPQHQTISGGIDFIRRNRNFDRWFCQIETFDPHEPFFVQPQWKERYPDSWTGGTFDFPEQVPCNPQSIENIHIRAQYAALVTFCDAQLGRVLDVMDELDLWKDTMLIVNTDHGWLMGEHDWWGKCLMPFWQEVAHIPMWVWDPRHGHAGEQRSSLVQTMDLAPTLLEYFGVPIPVDMQGSPLGQVLASDAPIRGSAIFGMYAGHVNCTDGRYVYMRGAMASGNKPLYQYTHMPTHMICRFGVDEMQRWEKHPGFNFTKGCPVMQIPTQAHSSIVGPETLLYDLQTDPFQLTPMTDPVIEERMIGLLVAAMRAADAPPEQYVRLGLV